MDKKKIYFAIYMLAMMVFLVGSVSAFQVKDFNKDVGHYGKITIEEREWYDPFGWIFVDNVSENVLTKNTDVCLFNCEAEGTTTLYANGTLFDDLSFWKGDKNKNRQDKTTVPFNIFIKKNVTTTGKVELFDDKNQSLGFTDYENTKEEWVDYNFETLPSGTYKWKITATKSNPSDRIDWIFKKGNIDLEDWAWWDSLTGDFQAFTSGTSNWTVPAGVGSVEVLVVGGGGGGGTDLGGGGGAGGLILNGSFPVTAGTNVTVIVGSGGSATNDGSNSSFGSLVAWGGGAGGTCASHDGHDGGSGGGEGGCGSGGAIGLSLGGQGNNGGYDNEGTGAGGGGGGAGESGYNSTGNGADGGNGTVIWSLQCLAGGGGGGDGTNDGQPAGSGGCGGGDGGTYNGQAGASGTANTGGGGGGGGSGSVGGSGGSGGSGLVIVRWNQSVNIDLVSPANDSTFTVSIVNFSANATDPASVGINNISLILDGVINDTNSSGLEGFYNWSVAVAEGDHNWTVQGYDSSNNLVEATNGTLTFGVDYSPPVVSDDNVTDIVTYSLPANLVWNYSASDLHLDSCYYNTTENSTYTVVTCNSPISTSFNGEGNKTIQYCANDTYGFETCANAYSYVTLINVSQADNPDPVGEGVAVVLNLSVNSTSIPTTTATLILNNTLYNPTTIVAGTNGYYFEQEVVIPFGWGSTTGNNVSWYWNYTINGLVTNTSTSSENLTVYELAVDNCSSYGDVILNFTLKDEGSNSILEPPTTNNTEIQLDLEITSLDNSSLVYNFSTTWYNMTNGNAQVCVPTGLLSGGADYRIDFINSYIADDHVEEFFYLDNGVLNSSSYLNELTSKNITFYDLLLDDSTTFLFSFFDENNLIVPNAIVHTFRYYIGDGLFREVERGQQDDNGETHLHLLEEDAVYYFVITLDSEILYTSSQYNAKCQEVPCVIQLYGSQEVNPFPTTFNGLPQGTYSVTGNKTTRNVTLSFNLNTTKTMNLTVYQLFGNSSETDILIGTNSLTASSGSVVVSVPELYGNITFYAIVHADEEPVGSQFIDLTPSANDIFPDGFGVFLAFLVIITLGLAGATQGVWSMLFIVVGFIVTSLIKLLDMNYTALVFLICLVALLIYKLTERKG